MLRVEMLSTGDEVLHGQIIDTNSAWLSDYCFEHGLPLTLRSTAGDDLKRLVEILTLRSQFADILIVNGGLGPTKDDLSAEAAALALGVELEVRPEWVEKMTLWFAKRERHMPESNLKQAMLPKGAELIDNPVGSACGFSIILNNCLIFFTPGVPSEFKVMVQHQIMPRLRRRFDLPEPPVCLRLTTFGRSESQLAQQLDSLTLPENVTIGYRSASPVIEIKLNGPAEQESAMLSIWQKIKTVADKNTLYEGINSLPQVIAGLLKEKSLSIAVCEQFTAGLVSLQLSNAEAPMRGGQYLTADLELSLNDLSKLALKTRLDYGSDIALAVGNNALQHIDLALATPDIAYVMRFHYNSHSYSLENQRQTVAMLALDILRRWLNGWPVAGDYEWLEIVEIESFYQ